MKNYDTNDIDNGLEDIRGMAILAIRTSEALAKARPSRGSEGDESLSFCLHDILTRVERVKECLHGERLDATPSASASPVTDADLGDSIRDAVSMTGIAAEMASRRLVAPEDDQLLFAIVQAHKMLEGLKGRYDATDVPAV